MSSLPIIDVEKYFNDPAIPDGSNVGFVSPQGVVHDCLGRAIGIDSKHENAKNQDVLARISQLVESAGRGSVTRVGHAPDPSVGRRIERSWRLSGQTFAEDNFGDLWVLCGSGLGRYWDKAERDVALPPLPQGA